MFLKEYYEFGPVDFQENDPPAALTADHILADLGKDDDPDEEIKELPEEEKEEEKEEEEEDEDKIEIVEEEDDVKKAAEDENVEDILAPLSRKAVLKKYPNVFKDFPQLEKGYYGNIEYRKVFPNVQEAKEAAEKVEQFNTIETELKKGDSTTLLKNIKEDNEENFAKVVDSYLPNLEKIDERAYFHVIGNVIKRMVFAMAESSKENKDDDLLTAAKIVKGYMFGEKPIDGITSFSKGESKEKDELSEDRKNFDAERFNARKGEVTDKVSRIVKNTLDKHIDPRESMSAYVKKNAVREAQESVDSLMNKDKEFQKYIERMWESAKKANYSEDSTGKIRSAYISKAKTLLPQVIRKIRNEALKESGRESEGRTKKDKGIKLTGKRSTPSNDKGGKDDKKDGKGMSTYDFLNSDQDK